MPVGEICNRDVIIIDKNATVEEAARLMRTHHVGALVVTEQRAGVPVPAGLLTDRDIVIEVIAEDVAPGTVLVGDIMSRDLLTALEQDGIWETMQRMRIKGVRRVPVVNRHGGLEGLVSLDDLLELISEELAQLAKLVSREQAREANTRP